MQTLTIRSPLINFLIDEIDYLRDQSGEATTRETIWHAVAHAAGLIANDTRRLNDHNLLELGYRVEIHRPLEGATRWIRNDFIQKGDLVVNDFKEERVPAESNSAVDWVIRHGAANCLYGVDPDNPDNVGEVNLSSSQLKLSGCECLPRTFLLKLVSVLNEELAVIKFEKISSKDETTAPPTPDDQAKERIELRLLRFYFADGIPLALEAVRGRAVEGGLHRLTKQEQPASQFLFHTSSRETSFLGLKVEQNSNPSLNFHNIERAVIDKTTDITEAATGRRPKRDEMRNHVIMVSEAQFIRDGEKVVAFGTSRYFDGYTNNRGKKEKLTLLWGTMVDPSYRNRGLMVWLNYQLMRAAKKAVRNVMDGPFRALRTLFKPAPINVRTQSQAVLDACQKFFVGVTKIGEQPKPRYQHMTAFVAKEEGWELDKDNIQHNAYDAPISNPKDLIPGLGPKDAYNFSGDFTLGRELLAKIYVSIIYPVRASWKAWRKRA